MISCSEGERRGATKKNMFAWPFMTKGWGRVHKKVTNDHETCKGVKGLLQCYQFKFSIKGNLKSTQCCFAKVAFQHIPKKLLTINQCDKSCYLHTYASVVIISRPGEGRGYSLINVVSHSLILDDRQFDSFLRPSAKTMSARRLIFGKNLIC